MTRTDRRRFPILIAAIAALALAMTLLFSPVQAQEGSVPDKPRGLEATATHGQVVLTWDDPQDESITGYVILRRVRVNDTGGDFDVLVSDTGTAATSYTDDTVSAETRYTYRIKAINGAGTSERSRWFHIDTPAAPVAAGVLQPRSAYVDAHNAGVHDLAELTDGADPLNPDAGNTEEEARKQASMASRSARSRAGAVTRSTSATARRRSGTRCSLSSRIASRPSPAQPSRPRSLPASITCTSPTATTAKRSWPATSPTSRG